ncbi:hypothetical protein DQW77_03440 [Roseovarius sp. TE539]|nr:hypothetical protein DQW77_03440 [Roseovarius sp. TE539]
MVSPPQDFRAGMGRTRFACPECPPYLCRTHSRNAAARQWGEDHNSGFGAPVRSGPDPPRGI